MRFDVFLINTIIAQTYKIRSEIWVLAAKKTILTRFHIFGQVCHLIANICGPKQYSLSSIAKRRCKLRPRPCSVHCVLKLVNFSPQTGKIVPEFWPTQNQLFLKLITWVMPRKNSECQKWYRMFANAFLSFLLSNAAFLKSEYIHKIHTVS